MHINLNLSGIGMMAEERDRQIVDEKWSPEHDDEHVNGELVLAAVCYAAPVKVFRVLESADSYVFEDPWPWELYYDKRNDYGRSSGGLLPDPSTYTPHQRIDLLVKAGALIAAEIDRLVRIEKKRKRK